MGTDPAARDARLLMRTALQQGVKATSLCRAIMGWLCDAPTDPSVAEIQRSGDGWIWLRLSDEADLEPLCLFRNFVEQVRIICRALRMTEEQTQQIVGWAQMRLF